MTPPSRLAGCGGMCIRALRNVVLSCRRTVWDRPLEVVERVCALPSTRCAGQCGTCYTIYKDRELCDTRCEVVRMSCEVLRTRSKVVRTRCEVLRTRSKVVRMRCEVVSIKSKVVRTRCEVVSTKSKAVRMRREVVSTKSKVMRMFWRVNGSRTRQIGRSDGGTAGGVGKMKVRSDVDINSAKARGCWECACEVHPLC